MCLNVWSDVESFLTSLSPVSTECRDLWWRGEADLLLPENQTCGGWWVCEHQLCFRQSLKQHVDSFLYPPTLHSSAGSSTGSIKARFENIAKQKEEEDRKRAEEERARRQAKEKQEQEEARRKMEEKAPSPVPAAAASPSPTPSPTPPVQPAAAATFQVSPAGCYCRVQTSAEVWIKLLKLLE